MPEQVASQEAGSALDALLGGDGFLVVAPHPDDETLGCGALLAAAFTSHRPARVLVLTDGDKSHRNSAAWSAGRLGSRRRAEAIEAVRRLGGGQTAIGFLGYPDCELPTAGDAFEAAVEQVRDAMSRIGCRTLVVTSPADPHCDHQAAARIANRIRARDAAIRVLFYPIWSRQPGRDLSEGGKYQVHRFPVAAFALAKRHALMAHETQLGALITDDPGGFVLPRDFMHTLLGEDEIYMERTDAHGHA